MQTKVEFQGAYTIVQVSGRLDIDKTTLFKQACLKSLKGQKVIFSLQNLNFVGSTGILNFFQVLKEVHELNNRTCRVVGLSNDFKRIIHLAEFQCLEFHETVETATFSFENPGSMTATGEIALSSVPSELEVTEKVSLQAVISADGFVADPERNS